MKIIKKDPRPLAVRLWIFQRERAPLYGIVIMAATTAGVVYNFSRAPLWNYIAAILIISLYLIQIRTADEHKDFEHDNKFHKDRPVQRGVVSLDELAVINTISKIGQIALYAFFLDVRIFMLGLFSQGYAYLTRKEFFVRDWIRKHFFIYYFSHYLQLVILFYAIVSIVKPEKGISYWLFVALFMLGVIGTELGRKMYPLEQDTTDDTYSAQLGHKGSAVALSLLTTVLALVTIFFIYKFPRYPMLIAGPTLVWGLVLNSAYHYALKPDRKNAKAVEQATNLMYVICMLSIILGA